MVLEQFSVWTLVLIGAVLALGIFFHLFRYSSKTAEVAPAILTRPFVRILEQKKLNKILEEEKKLE